MPRLAESAPDRPCHPLQTRRPPARFSTDVETVCLRGKASAGVERWRTQGAAPLADVAMREACETMAHTYESLYVELHEPRR